MTILELSTQAMLDLHALTVGFKTGSIPDAHSVLGIQADLVRYYMELGQEMASKFGQKESRYLARKIEEANQYKKGRLNPEKKIADVTQDAFLAIGEDYQREIDAAEEYERYRTMLRSLQNALDYARSVVSYVKSSEAS